MQCTAMSFIKSQHISSWLSSQHCRQYFIKLEAYSCFIAHDKSYLIMPCKYFV